ncbi:MAG: c-type cytochrome [Spirosomataceae bacterium]
MKKWIGGLFVLTAVWSLSALTPAHRTALDAREDSLAADRAKYSQEVMAAIKGKENKPADSVFKNIQVLKGLPAEQVVSIMETNWSKALGVSCAHCHNVKDWASDEKKDKFLTVEMVQMTNTINDNLIKNMKTYAGRQRTPKVSCMTCHRGEAHPMRSQQQGRRPPQQPPRN